LFGGLWVGFFYNYFFCARVLGVFFLYYLL